MSESGILSFDEFCNLLIPIGALNSPAELHGFLCGKLCGGAQVDDQQWLAKTWDFLDVDIPKDDAVHSALLDLKHVTDEQLSAGHYGLRLLLPDDETSLEQRLQCLSQWCYGFLSGIGSAGIAPDYEMSADNADALKDIAAIVQVSVSDQDDQETQEADYTDLVEYVRIVALSIYAEFHSTNEEDVTLH